MSIFTNLSIDLIHLGKYARKSFTKFKEGLVEKYKGKVSDEIIEEMAQDMLKTEIKAGIQIVNYQINLMK